MLKFIQLVLVLSAIRAPVRFFKLWRSRPNASRNFEMLIEFLMFAGAVTALVMSIGYLPS